MIDWLQKSWTDAGDQYDRDLADAMQLPWVAGIGLVGGALAVLGCLIGLLLSLPGAFAGGIIGFLLGWLICLPLKLVAFLLPTPFAWISRRIGYA